ncbi:class III lanthionine synthetase LanKC [Spirillospora sp. NPDC048911]|uniref:class III lanthionine synthetase LanKC n=1 Tax=Spirillospora sp. NPDC048911 TaxID=3364527 RepID=UPI0037232C64
MRTPTTLKRYESFCLADPDFFDAPERMADEGSRFPQADQPAPEGWTRGEAGLWIVLAASGRYPEQGWRIDVSSAPPTAAETVERVWDYCADAGIGFRFLRSEAAVRTWNADAADRLRSGVLARLYPVTDAELDAALRELSGRLAGVAGPAPLGARRVGPLYVRYDSDLTCADADGEPVRAFRHHTGHLEPAPRRAVFTVPDWVSVPEAVRPHLTQPKIRFPYRIDEVLNVSNGGGTYRSGQWVLREARPHAGLDEQGVDAVERLVRHRRTLERLEGLDCVPKLIGCRDVWEHRYLIEEYVAGTSLFHEVLARHPLGHEGVPEVRLRAYAEWAVEVSAQVGRALDAIAGRGVQLTELHPKNVILRPGGVTLVGLEHTGPGGSPAFSVPPGHREGGHHYLLACLRLWMFLPINPPAPGKLPTLAAVIDDEFPVRPGFGAGLVRALGGDGGRDEAAAMLERSSWPELRDSLVAGLHADATPGRPDRLFPGSPGPWGIGGHAFDHGAAGVLHALHLVGAEVPDIYVDWLVSAARRDPRPRPGLYDGLHGVAAVLAELGRRDCALEMLARADQTEEDLPEGLASGLSGIALNWLHFAELTGDGSYLDRATRAGHRLGSSPGEPGLFTGSSGPALLFVRLYETTGDPFWLAQAESALRQELSRCRSDSDGALLLFNGKQNLPYVRDGSAGIALVLHRYLQHRPSAAEGAALDGIRRACAPAFVRLPGLFDGRAGFVTTLMGLGSAADERAARSQVRRLAVHARLHGGRLAFPGTGLLRLSLDLATGSAGILLALRCAFERGPSGLLHVDAPGHHRVARGGDTHGRDLRAPGAGDREPGRGLAV